MGETQEATVNISDDAKKVLCALFFAGAKSSVKSHPPHATVADHAAAFQELLDAGLITKEPFNDFDIWLYRGTDRIDAALGAFKVRWYSQILTTKVAP